MSAATISARVAEIDAMLNAVAQGPRPAADASATSFAQTLQAAQGATAVPASAGTSGSTPFGAEIDAAAQRYGIDPALLKGLIRQESGFDPAARSSAGATGLTQLMPGTAASRGGAPTDPAQAIDGGARYLKQQLDRFGGDPSLALAAYNAGPGAVAKFGGVPPYGETQAYVQKVLAFADQYRAPAAVPAVSALPATTTPVPAAPAPAASSPGSLGYSTI
jgi:soluble lytic murein transglycosylase-like protein